MANEWSFLEVFQPFSRKLSAVLGEKVDHARVAEIRPPRLVIDG